MKMICSIVEMTVFRRPTTLLVSFSCRAKLARSLQV